MSSSELSNALNPNIVSRRPRNREPHAAAPAHPDESSQVVEHQLTIEQPEPRPHLPHRSELELAIIEPAPRQIPSASYLPVHEQAV